VRPEELADKLRQLGWDVFKWKSLRNGVCAVRDWATDPKTGENVLLDEAIRRQEARQPGSVRRRGI
jgi:hypothetical protein